MEVQAGVSMQQQDRKEFLQATGSSSAEPREARPQDTHDFSVVEDLPDPPPVYILLLAFMFMFQGYGVMNGNPQHVLKVKLYGEHASQSESEAFQNATASFQLAKLLMRILQIAFLVFMQPSGIIYVAYVVMFIAVLVPIIFVWCLGLTDLWCVYLQYLLGGIAVGLFEGTFLSVISSLGRNTKTFVIMGTPLGFAVHNVVLGTFQQWGMPTIIYYLYSALCIPVAILIFYKYAPQDAPSRATQGQAKGCQVFVNSFRHSSEWIPALAPWLIAKFVGNFVLEDCFPLLYNTFNTQFVPIFGGPGATAPIIPMGYYTSLYFFVMVATGDTISRRVPYYISLRSWAGCTFWIVVAICLCVGGLSLNFFLIAIVTGLAAFLSNFGNGFIYGLSAKFIDAHIPIEHHYAAYNLWCFCGDIGGYAGQGGLSVQIAQAACNGHHYKYVCALPETTTPTTTTTTMKSMATFEQFEQPAMALLRPVVI